MNIQKITKTLIDSGIEENEAHCEMKLMLEGLFNYTEKDKLQGKVLSNEQLKILKEKVLQRINTKIPVQYLIGKAWFMGNFFKVTPDVLIPRDETEILVKKAIEIIEENSLKTVLDIGTGSGCIACTIAKQTNATVLGIDISSDALRIALDNVTALNINNKAVFRKSDLFSKIRKYEKFDLIISNPPYIPYGTVLQAEVKHEPSIALFAENDGLEFYKKIIKDSVKYLNKDGFLIFELGIEQSECVNNMMSEDFAEICILKDLAGIDRVISGKFIK